MLLGLNLLNLFQNNVRDLKTKFGFQDWPNVFYTWTITAMGHDFGYPYEVAKELLGNLADLYEGLSMNRFARRLISVMNSPDIATEEKLFYYIPKTEKPKTFRSYFSIKQFIKESIGFALKVDTEELSSIEKN
jgi:hypothetical protein